MLTALERAKQALAHHDLFNRFVDNHALYMVPGMSGAGTLYELPHDDGQFTVADLRALVDYAERSPRVGDGSGDAAIAIGEHAFRAGYKRAADRARAFYPTRIESDEAHMEQAWSEYDPPEDIKALS